MQGRSLISSGNSRFPPSSPGFTWGHPLRALCGLTLPFENLHSKHSDTDFLLRGLGPQNVFQCVLLLRCGLASWRYLLGGQKADISHSAEPVLIWGDPWLVFQGLSKRSLGLQVLSSQKQVFPEPGFRGGDMRRWDLGTKDSHPQTVTCYLVLG